MKDTAGQCSHQHRMPSPSSQGLMSFNALCLPKSNWWEVWLRGEKGEISTTACTILLFSLPAPVECKGRRAERESKLDEKYWNVPTAGEDWTCPELFFPLVEAKPFTGSQPQRSGNCRTASKHYQGRSPSAIRHINRKTAQPQSRGLTAFFQFNGAKNIPWITRKAAHCRLQLALIDRPS